MCDPLAGVFFPPQQALRAELLEYLHQPPSHYGLARSRWTLELLPQHGPGLQLLRSPSGVWRRLQKWHLRRKQSRSYIHSPDPHYDTKVRWIQAAQGAQVPGQVILLYADEHTFYRQPVPGQAYEQQGSGGQHQPRAYRSCASNTKRRTVATLEAGSGRVLHRSASKIGVQALCAFCQQVRQTYNQLYGSHVRLLLVWDNWPVHYRQKVLQAAQAAGLELLWLPTYAPWLNPIEKLWRKLQEEVLSLHRLSEVWETLKSRVHEYLSSHNRVAPDLLRYVGLD